MEKDLEQYPSTSQRNSRNSLGNELAHGTTSNKYGKSTQSHKFPMFCGFILSIKSSVMITMGFVILVCTATLVGVLVVCFTTPNPNKTCQSHYKSTLTMPIGHDSYPRSVALGDFDRDNQTDIVVACPDLDSVRILFGNIDGTFKNQTEHSVGSGSSPHSVTVGDFNNDNYPDVGVANYGTNTISILLGDGNGMVSMATTFSTGQAHPLFITVGHFNNNNTWLDIVVVNYGTHSIGVFLGLGNGSLVLERIYSTGYDSFPNCVVVANLNDDNRLDIVVANYGTNNIGIFFGYGDGTFTNQIIYSTGVGSQPYSVAVDDFNRDNKLDIVVANSGLKSVGVLYGQRNGTFATMTKYLIRAKVNPFSVAVGNLNGDIYQDIVTVNSDDDNICILIGDSNNTFTTQLMYLTGDRSNPNQLVIHDIDADNRSDIVIANSGHNNVLVLIGYGVSSIPKVNTIFTGLNSKPDWVVVGDFNNDYSLDIAETDMNTSSVNVFLGHGDGTFSGALTYSLGHGLSSGYMVTSDFNSDNKLDIAIAHSTNNTISIILGIGNGTFGNIITYTTQSPQSLAVSDFNNDNILDIIVANEEGTSLSIFFGYGNGTFVTPILYPTGEGSFPKWIVAKNWTDDIRLVVFILSIDRIGVIFVEKNGTFGSVTSYATDFASPHSVAVDDFNNDGKLDIVIGNLLTSTIGVYLAQDNRTFSSQKQYSTGDRSSPQYMVVGDFDSDNRSDIIVALQQNIGILYGYGNGTFSTIIQYSIWDNFCPRSIAVGDFTHDNHLNIVVGNPCTNTLNINIGYYNASFKSNQVYSTGFSFHPPSVAMGDFNNDNRTDMVIGSFRGGTIGIFTGYGNGTFELGTYSTGSISRPQYVIVGDFNKDHQLDIVTANYQNGSISAILGYGNGTFRKQLTYSIGSTSAPRAAAVADFDNNSWLDLIVVNEGTDSVSLFLGFNYATFPNQKIFSTSQNLSPDILVVDDFNNDNHLDMVAVSSYSDSMNLFLGNGNGTFQNVINYPLANVTKTLAIAVGDFNNDKQLDIIIGNGFHFTLPSPLAGTVTVVCGNGDGTFGNLIQSSIGNGSDPTSIIVADFNSDHQLDIVVVDGGTDSIRILFGNGDGTFDNISVHNTAHSKLSTIAVDDFNNDNRFDIAILNDTDLIILLGYGNGTFETINTSSIENLPGARPIVVGDFNNDNQTDIAFCVSSGIIGILIGHGNGTFTNLKTYSFSDQFLLYTITAGDLNNDKRLDIVISDSNSNSIGIVFGHGDGTFTMMANYSNDVLASPRNVVLGDFNEDNKLDIAVVNQIKRNVVVSLNYDIEPFVTDIKISIEKNARPWAVAVGDFDNNSKVDMVIANNGTNNIAIFLGYGDGTFANMVKYSTGDGSQPQSVAVGDFNKDMKLDIVVVNYGTNSIVVFLGYGNGSFQNMIVHSLEDRSHPYSIAVSDFNNDKILDIAVTNYGSNNFLILHGHGNGTFTKYWSYASGFESRPYSIAISDLNNDSLMDIAIANFGSSTVEVLLKIC